MMKSILDQINSIIEQVNKLPNGNTKIELMEEAIRLADVHQRPDIGFDLRDQLMTVATFCGAPEKTLVAFSWCLAQCDQNPEEFDQLQLLWKYKWVVSSLKYFPHIRLDQINQAMEDMTKRYQGCGLGLRPVYKLACEHAMARKDYPQVKHFQRLWRSSPIGSGNDCAACERDSQVGYYLFDGDIDRAFKAAEPIVTGQMKCGEVPHVTLPQLLVPLLRRKDYAKATHYYFWATRLLKYNPDFISEYGKILTFLALTGNPNEGLPILEAMLPAVMETKALSRRFYFQLGASLLLHYLQESGSEQISIRIPKELKDLLEKDFAGASGAKEIDKKSVSVQSFIQWVDADLQRIATLFDKRNGTDAFTRNIEDSKNDRELFCLIPLKAVD